MYTYILGQTTPATSFNPQNVTPTGYKRGQSINLDSVPVQSMLSKCTGALRLAKP